MRRAGSSSGARAVSPTNTSYSGISNYRTDSYRPSQAQSAPQDARQIAKAHYEELSKYLASYLANEPANSRSAARQKLTRLTRQQFQELSTDVYDELIRRKNNADSNDIPFLPVRDDFHPKRNQARQKLATLPTSRFKDLSSDVYYELVRRYPEFKEQEAVDEPVNSPGSTYDDYPSPDFPAASRSSHTDSPSTVTGTQASAPAHRSNGSYSSSIPRTSMPSSPPLPPTPYTAASNAEDYASTGPVPRTSQEAYPSTSSDLARARMMQDDYTPTGTSSRRRPSDDYSVGSRRRPSEDFAPVGRRPSASSNGTGASGTSANMATSGMIIPAKSTIAEEEIEVPFARRGQDDGEDGDHDQDDDAGYAGPGRRLRSLSGDLSPESASDGDDDRRQYFDRMSTSRGSTTSERAIRSGSDRDRGARASAGSADGEKVRREYEFRIATMQSKIVGLEREAEERTSVIEEYRRQAQEEAAERSRDADELARLRERCRELEMQLEDGENRRRSKEPDHDAIAIIEQLRSDTENLLAELSDVSARGEEMVLARETDAEVIRGLEHEVREWKKKYEAAKTELRSVKATSQLYTPKPSFADNLSVAPNGSIRDSHITSFLTSIDALLTAGRSNNPAQVLEPLKAVVDSVSAILDDFRVSVREGGFTQPSRIEDFDSLQDRAEATLGNLVATAKTHATSAGLAPVSLLDAAASHVAVVITDINKIAYNHRIAQGDYDHTTSKILPTSASAWISSQRSVDDGNHGHHRRDHSRASSSSRHAAAVTRRPRSTRTDDGSSFENGTSPLPLGLAQANRIEAGASPIGHGTSEEAWAELKPYLEAQTESIVYAIQSVLSGVRSPTPSSTLTENLTQIITIVSSIVAVCSDALSPGNTQGHDILHDLSEHANKLSEMQALTDVTKESRQVMAKSSFAIANAMKALQKL